MHIGSLSTELQFIYGTSFNLTKGSDLCLDSHMTEKSEGHRLTLSRVQMPE